MATPVKWRVFHLRINNLTDANVMQVIDAYRPHAREVTCGVREVGKSSGIAHHHFHVVMLEQTTLFRMRSLLPLLLLNQCGPDDVYLAPSLHYSDSSKTIEMNRDYCTKNGVFHSYVLSSKPRVVGSKRALVVDDPDDLSGFPAELPSAEDPILLNLAFNLSKDARYKLARRYVPDSDDLAPLALYEQMHRIHGHNTAKAFFTELYHTTAGLSVRKAFPGNQSAVVFPGSDDQEVLWIEGPAGSGKTSFLQLLYPGNYQKNKDTVYWETYNFTDHTVNNPHMAVVFNELDTVHDLLAFSPNSSSFDTVKNMLDVFPFPIEIKHKAQELIRPRRIFITSNTTLSHIMHMANILSRQSNHGNKLFGLDVNTLSAALHRRMISVSIDEVLEVYNCFVVKKIPFLGFGGVFHNSLRSDIGAALMDILQNETDPVAQIQKSHLVRKEMETRTIELLKPLRWVSFSVVRDARDPPPVHVLSRLLEERGLVTL